MPFGHSSVTYDVCLPNRNIILRTNDNPAVFKGTARNLEILSRLGLPVSHVITTDLSKSRYPFAYMILEKIPGRDLRYELSSMTAAQMTRLARHIVAFQRKVATLPQGTGFGYVPIGETGRFSSWWELVQHETLKNTVGQSSEMDRWLERVQRLAREKFSGYFEQIRPTCFLDDVTIKNVMVLSGELQGLVDFDCVCYGDPLFMVALTAAGIVSDIGTRELFYVEALCEHLELKLEQRQVVALYAALFSLDFIRRMAAH